MSTYIIISLDLRRPKKDGTFPIIFRLTHNRKTTSISSGYSTRKKFWDVKNRCLRSSYTGTESVQRLNNLLTKRKSHYIDQITKIQEKDELKYLSVKQLKGKLIVNTSDQRVFTFVEHLIKDLEAAKRIGTAVSYTDTLRSLKKFRSQKDLTFNELNLDFLKKYETDYLSRGNSLGGLAVYMRTIRAIYNKAIKAGIAEEEGYPFKHYTIRNGKTRKRAIPMEAIKKIKGLKLKRNTTLYRDRNIFLMSFYLQGMPYSDLAHLKVSNIIDGRIQYDRQKTKEPFDIKIPDQLWPVIKVFIKGKKIDDYLIPAIKRESELLKFRDIEWARKRYNKNLKTIAQKAGIEEKLTSYVSRHSYASIADEMGIPVTAISQMLGHEKVSTTQAYLDKLRRSKLDKYQDEVISGLK
jgi:site-specific recombinase XerD